MKIGELFVALGFKVEGDEKLDQAEQSMGKATVKAAALAVAVNSINYAFLRMMDAARAAAVEVKNFVGITGLGADELQRWRRVGAVNDVDSSEIDKVVAGIQRASAEVRLGRGNIAPFQLLGISPNSDPFDILRQLREKIRELPPEMARLIASEMGVSDSVFVMLRSANFELAEFNKNLAVTDDERRGLLEMNRAWKELVFSLAQLRDKFAAAFAPALAKVAQWLRVVVDWIAILVDWLNKGGLVAKIVTGVLIGLVAVTAALGAALAALVVVLGVLTAAMIAFDAAAWASGIPEIIIGITLALVAFVAIVSTVVLLVDDFWTALQGGKSFFNWNEGILMTVKNVERLAIGLEKLMDLADRMPKNPFLRMLGPTGWAADFLTSGAGKGTGSNVSQKNDIRVMIDGSRSPEETARATAREVGAVISDAYYQLPLTT